MFKRLTKLKGNYVCWNGNQDYSTRDRYIKVLDRLAAYEDTGLTPEQIQSLAADKDEQAGRIMQMEEALRQTKTVINELMACNEISKIADVRGEDAIKAIEALLGGKEDEKE